MSVGSRAPAEPDGTAGSAVTWPVMSGLVPPLAEGFVARPESAPGLGQVLAPGACVALTPARAVRAAVAPGSPDWPGSCGKTQLAVYLAESMWNSRELDLLVWVTATSRASILSAYTAAAAAVIGIDPAGDAETVAARFLGWLAETSRPWLVVLDDLSAPADAEGLWPAGRAGRTLVTTAEPAAAFARPQLVAFPMTGLSRREALSYLLGRLTDDRGQRTGAIDLVDLLGGEPLALGQASAVLGSSALSCRDYTDHFSRKRVQLAGGFQGRPAATAISWTLCVEQAYRLLPGGPVQPVLILAAVLDGHAIPGTVFTAAAAREYAGHAVQGPASQEGIWACVSCLETASLLTVDRACTPPVVRMHPAVQAAVRTAASREALSRAALAAADALLEAWPADDEGGWLADILRASALSIIRLAGELLWTGNRYQLLFRTGRSLGGAHLTMLAAAHWNHVAAASERYLGPEHPDALAASDQLAAAFLAASRALEALPWFRRVLADRVRTLGSDHPATIEFEVSMGRALLAAGRADEAIALFERLTSDRAHLQGAEHPDAADAREALADAYCAAGRLADGIMQYKRTLTERERGQGQSHPATMTTCEKLADAYLAADRIKESLAAYKRVAAGRERTLGPDHPDTIEARAKLALAYQSAGRMAMAIQLHEQSRADSERVLGIDHVATLTRRLNLAHAYYAVGRIGDAASLLRDTVERCERVLPTDDPLLRTVRESLANLTG
ncbi:MAG TPA: tetratricopeptide repeat protein [Streptosporangiaceae bacterium]|nr:tetratricopeptide repeat protein [Streptosporangiaceae bacterium]